MCALKAVALDVMGVMYRHGDDLRDLLIPFLRGKGCAVSDEAIIQAYRECYRDGKPSELIWQTAGIDGVEDEFLQTYELNAGVMEFLESMQISGVPVFLASNDIAEWAVKRRVLHGIDLYISGALISGELRIRKPDPRFFELLVEMLGCKPHECLFVDDRPDNIEGARAMGLEAVLFGGQPRPGFTTVEAFAQLRELILSAPPNPQTK